MSNQYLELAKKIPAEIRSNILNGNMIQQAIGFNEYMKYLFEAWFLYIDPEGHKDWNCGFCRENVKSNFTKLLPSLLELDKNSKLLDAI